MRVVSMKYVDDNKGVSVVKVYSESWNKEMFVEYDLLQKTD